MLSRLLRLIFITPVVTGASYFISKREKHQESIRSTKFDHNAVHVRTKWQHVQYWMLVALLLTSMWYFWSWWLQPIHQGNVILYSLMSLALAYQFTVLPGFYIFFLGWMRKPIHIDPDPGLNVAMITLTVPGSESMDIGMRQLAAMKEVRYPHDSWILVDGVHSPEIKAHAEDIGVKYFSRHDVGEWGKTLVDKWNSPCPPYRAETKAGNVNAWLDAIKVLNVEYEYFTQLDVDHVPIPGYLDQVLGHFQDSDIAWVQAPSIYSNLEYWTSRGSAEQELVLQGPLQSGFYGFSKTPFIIGSHCTFRMEGIRRIGGFQPTRAEDHLDTVVLAAHGYRGVFVPETIAFGDGPESIEMYLAQQFAWAYSMMQVLFGYTPRLVLDYTFRQAGQFLFAQTWYVLWSTTLALLFALPSIALLTGEPISHTGYLDFLQRSAPGAVTAITVWWWSRKWFQPKNVSLSWRGVVLHVARWPVVLSALIQVILRVEKPYMITRKGVDHGDKRPFLLKTHIPYFALILVPLGVCSFYLLMVGRSSTQGYLLFALQGALAVFLVFATALAQDMKQLKKEVGIVRSIKLRAKAVLVCTGLFISLIVVGCASAPRVHEAITATESATFIPERTPDTEATAALMETQEVMPTSVIPERTATETPIPSPQPTFRESTLEPDALQLIDLPKERMFLGVYDVWTKSFEEKELDIELNYFDWTDSAEMKLFMQEAVSKRRVPMISVEPFTTASGDDSYLLKETIEGMNDSLIRENAHAIKQVGEQVVLVRFAHEMELVGNYPWSTPDPGLSIEFYQHYVDIFRKEGVTNVMWVWSPAGNSNAPSYYPGSEYVDYVGVTILGNEAWDLQYGDHVNSFEDLFGEKYDTVAPLGKPIIIAELGVAGDPEHKQTWLDDAFRTLSKYPMLMGVVYFNALNAPNAWTGDTPDWRIDPGILWEVADMPKR